MTRIFEVGLEMKIGGKWSRNWSHRNVVARDAKSAIAKAERQESDDDGYPVRAESVRIVAET